MGKQFSGTMSYPCGVDLRESDFFLQVLVSWKQSSQHNLIVIPGNPGSKSGVARPGIQEFERLLDAGLHRHDGKTSDDFFNAFRLQDTRLGFKNWSTGVLG